MEVSGAEIEEDDADEDAITAQPMIDEIVRLPQPRSPTNPTSKAVQQTLQSFLARCSTPGYVEVLPVSHVKHSPSHRFEVRTSTWTFRSSGHFEVQ